MSNASIQADQEKYAQVTRDRAEDEARAEHRARETALAVRRERIMAALVGGWLSDGNADLNSVSDLAPKFRKMAVVIMGAAK